MIWSLTSFPIGPSPSNSDENQDKHVPGSCDSLFVDWEKVSMIRIYHNHILQTNPQHHEEEPQYVYSNKHLVQQSISSAKGSSQKTSSKTKSSSSKRRSSHIPGMF